MFFDRVLVLGLMASGLCFADTFVPTYESAGVQLPAQSAVCPVSGTCIIGTEDFDTLPAQTGGFTTDFGTGGRITGTYSGPYQLYNADEFGGVGGTGRYLEIFAADNASHPGQGSYTLTLTTAAGVPGVNYFGLWFSALDQGNLLQFYEGSTLVYSFTPADFIALVGGCTGSNPFCGNPTTPYEGQDNGEQFAYLNIYDTDGFFNKIVFTEQTGTGGGFESDDHTVAYMNPPTPQGHSFSTPEPGSLALLGAGGILLAFLARRRRLVPQIATHTEPRA
jgi:hypothetical protein